jgi:tetratricopeptide (TPR) repeat protein
VKRFPWRWSLAFLVVAFLVACDHAGEAERLVASAEQSRQAGQLQVAADLYHRAAGLRESDFDTQYQAALLDLEVHNVDEAEGHLEKAVALRPDFGPAHLNLGVVFVQRGRRAEGRQAFLEALRYAPRLTRAYYNLGVLELDDGHLDAAEALFKQALGLDPTHQASYVRLGSLYVKQQQFSAALPWLEQASRLNAHDPQAFFHLGLAYDGLGWHAPAVAAFRTSIELSPSAAAQYNLGTLLLKGGDVRGALPPLQAAVRLNPQFSDALYNLASVYAHLGERENALQSLQQAIQLNRSLAFEAQRDEDFRSLRSDADFAAITPP